MARTQQGTSATTIWMIVFCFFWLVSTVWLVVLYTGQEELRTTNARLQREHRQVVTPEEFRSIEVIKAASESGPTAIGLLEEARSKTAALATGESKDGVAAVRTKRDDLLRSIKRDKLVDQLEAYESPSLFEGFSQLYEDFKKENSRRRLAEERLEQLDSEVAKLVELNGQQKSDFDKLANDLQDRMNTVENERAAYRTEKDGAVAAMVKEFDLRKSQTDADLTSERQRGRLADSLLKEMKARLSALQDKYADQRIGPGKLTTARTPDGHVLTAVPGDEIVYIDRGEGSRLVLGLRFAVYSAARGIPEDGRAKAQIEVVSVSANSSECRIVRMEPGEAILEGDWIANPVYDPDRAPRFVVLGDFDLNRDGYTEANARMTIEAIIKDWGGTLSDEVTAFTDFVVVGAAPIPAKIVANPTPEQGARAEALQRLRDKYMATLNTAQTLAVPTMTQDVFLNFLGQPERVAAR